MMYLIGNWKMNGSVAFTRSYLHDVMQEMDALALPEFCKIIHCLPALWLTEARSQTTQHTLEIGAQDCHMNSSGAHTGDISATMLADIGADYVIVGHSERRADHHETNKQVAAKAQAAYDAGLTPIICIGESEAQRDDGSYLSVLSAQIDAVASVLGGRERIIIAYEPIWAIGTGRTPSAADIEEACAHVHQSLQNHQLSGAAVLYGGSVKASNSLEILGSASVNGVLVGGASIKLEEWRGIMQAAKQLVA